VHTKKKCCCTSATCNTTICVTGCGTVNPGATVQVKSGATVIASGTTDSAGCVTLNVGTAGTYTVVVSAARFNTNTASRALTCGGTVTISLTIASGFHCLSACCPGLPDTVYVTDGLGTTALTFQVGLSTWDGFGLSGYAGTGSFTISGVSVFTIVGVGSECILGSGVIRPYYQVFCRSNTTTTSTWGLERYWGEGHTTLDPTGWYYGDGLPGTGSSQCDRGFGPGFGGSQAIGSATITKSSACNPLAISGSVTASQNHLSDPGGGSFSVSE
jgi:hypothetical protein